MQKIDGAIDFLVEEKGEWVTYQGQEKKVLIIDVSNRAEYYQDKLLYTTFKIDTGDCIIYQGQKWLITSQVDQGNQSYQGRMRRTNYKVKMVVDGELSEYETIIEAISFSVTSTAIMTMLDGKLKVTLPVTISSQRITESQRFIIMGRAWKVIGVDRTRLGLLELHVDKDMINPNTDDVANGIANKDQIAVWDIQIQDFNPQVLLGEPTVYNPQVLKNGTVVTDRTFIWETNNDQVLSVADGIVTGHQLGEATLTLTVEGSPQINKCFTIEVVDKLAPAITYKMWSIFIGEGIKYYDFFDILRGDTGQFGVEKYVDGILAEVNDTYTFIVEPGVIPADRYTFKVVSDVMCEITCNMSYSSSRLKLKATSNETGQTVEVLIELYW